MNEALPPVKRRFKLEGLELLRFLCAAVVMLYHYLYCGPMTRQTPTVMSSPAHWMAYGRFGVGCFFIISGYVISLSGQNRSWFGFLKARFLRLAPGMFVCTSLIFIGLHLLPITGRAPTVGSYFWNATTLPLFFKGGIDNSFWSITIELRFYLAYALVLAWLPIHKHIVAVSAGWLALSFLALAYPPLKPQVLAPFSGYFLLGMLLFAWQNGIARWQLVLVLLPTFALTGLQVHENFAVIDMFDRVRSPLWVGYAVTAVCMALVVGAVHIKSFGRFGRLAIVLGGCTYPLYLIHQNTGYGFIRLLNRLLPRGSLVDCVALVTVGMILIAVAVSRWAEPPLRRLLQKGLAVAGQYAIGRMPLEWAQARIGREERARLEMPGDTEPGRA